MGFITQPSSYQNFAKRFRMVNDYAARTPGYGTGYPTGWTEDGTGRVEAVLLKDEYEGVRWEWKDVSIRDLWPPGSGDPSSEVGSIRSRFSRVSDYAERSPAYIYGYPNFHQADHGNGVVFGTILFKTGSPEAHFHHLTESQLSMNANSLQTNWDVRLKRTEGAAKDRARSDDGRYTYRFGLPTGHDAWHNNVHLYGAYLFGWGSGPSTGVSAQMGQLVMIPAAELPGYPYVG